jgi:atypical dual specificity phosphatase
VSEWFANYGYREVADGLLLGALPHDGDDVDVLRREGVTAVVNLVEDEEYADEQARPAVERALADAGIAERRIRLVDFGRLPVEQLDEAVAAVCELLEAGERVYLHCRAGWQRSAAVAIGAVALREDIELGEALGRIQRRKPSAAPLAHQWEDLSRWWRDRGSVR